MGDRDDDADDAGTTPTLPPDHETHLDRNRRVWGRWSDHYTLSEQDFEPLREATMVRLDLAPGDRVLDVGCGPGVNFAYLRERVGSSGKVLGIDYSPQMVERARDRVSEAGWENVEVVRADATTADLGEGFDAAVATLSLSVMPAPERTLRNIHDSLAPGGRLAVVDLRPIPSGPLRLFNPLISRLLRLVANWNADANVEDALRETFGEFEHLERGFGGTVFAAVVRKPA